MGGDTASVESFLQEVFEEDEVSLVGFCDDVGEFGVKGYGKVGGDCPGCGCPNDDADIFDTGEEIVFVFKEGEFDEDGLADMVFVVDDFGVGKGGLEGG